MKSSPFEKQSKFFKTRGGHRRGAGRKKGVSNKITTEVRQRILSSGKTPLEVLQYVYGKILEAADRMKPEEFHAVDSQVVDQLTLLERAAKVADKAAPYMHAQLQAIEHTGEGGGPINRCIRVEIVTPERRP